MAGTLRYAQICRLVIPIVLYRGQTALGSPVGTCKAATGLICHNVTIGAFVRIRSRNQ